MSTTPAPATHTTPTMAVYTEGEPVTRKTVQRGCGGHFIRTTYGTVAFVTIEAWGPTGRIIAWQGGQKSVWSPAEVAEVREAVLTKPGWR